jgi:hypothetical protein
MIPSEYHTLSANEKSALLAAAERTSGLTRVDKSYKAGAISCCWNGLVVTRVAWQRDGVTVYRSDIDALEALGVIEGV